MVPPGGRRASGRRGGSGSDAEHLARQSPKNVTQARRFFGRAGAADRGDPPPTSHGGRRCPCHRRVLRRPNSDALSNTSAWTVRTRRVAMPIGKVRPGHREATRGAANEPWKERFFSRAACSPPPADATTRLHHRRTGPDRRARPAAASDRRRLPDRERSGPGRGRAVAGAVSLAAGDDPRGQGGPRETARGLQTSPGKNVLLRGGLQPPGRSRAQGRSRTVLLPDPLRRGRRSPQRRPRLRNFREIGGLALHLRAVSGKESSHPLSGPRPGLILGCRRGRPRRT